MLKLIDTKLIDIDCITVYDATRFTLNEAIKYNAENMLQRNGVALYSLLDSIPEDTDDAFIMKGVNSLFAEGFSRKNSKKSALKLNDAARQGFLTGGTVPFGYQSVPVPNTTGEKQRRTLQIYPYNAKIVKNIFFIFVR